VVSTLAVLKCAESFRRIKNKMISDKLTTPKERMKIKMQECELLSNLGDVVKNNDRFKPFDPVIHKEPVEKASSSQIYGSLLSYTMRMDWYRAEEHAFSKDLLPIFIKILEKKKIPGVTKYLIDKYNLYDKVPRKIYKNLKNISDCEALGNPIIDNDYFGPTEVLIDESVKEEDFLRMQDFGFEEKDVAFIDQEGPLFDQITEEFLASKAVGVDCEFTYTLFKGEDSLISTVQLASESKAVIFDGLALSQSTKFVVFLKSLLVNKDIVKVAHTFGSDIKVLEQTYRTEFVKHL